eukprot:TRINITY_DN22252_c0_g1_i1.p1 TRINITY_DN22252_c0_g1~~TRINITY_DN22252_c0_g1_i1.p1  ORF type:complete len:109 (-),score=36.77 TRINITY_DN22252_c0_g1_i1:382-684(-)
MGSSLSLLELATSSQILGFIDMARKCETCKTVLKSDSCNNCKRVGMEEMLVKALSSKKVAKKKKLERRKGSFRNNKANERTSSNEQISSGQAFHIRKFPQ